MKKSICFFIILTVFYINVVSARISPITATMATQKLFLQKQEKSTSQLVKMYYPDGNIKSERYYNADGQLNGEFKSYYPNGNLFERGYYKNGLQDGIITVYYENGKILCSSHAKNGHLSGNVKCYYPNGKLKSESYTENGFTPKTSAKYYYENGKIAIDGIFSQGEIISVNYYDEKGDLLTSPQDIMRLLLDMDL